MDCSGTSFWSAIKRSEDDQIRFEQEIAEISAERDAIEKARLILLEDHEKLKTEAVGVLPSLLITETIASFIGNC
jgi:hypothetical protein